MVFSLLQYSQPPKILFPRERQQTNHVRIDYANISDEARGKEETKTDDVEGGEERWQNHHFQQ